MGNQEMAGMHDLYIENYSNFSGTTLMRFPSLVGYHFPNLEGHSGVITSLSPIHFCFLTYCINSIAYQDIIVII